MPVIRLSISSSKILKCLPLLLTLKSMATLILLCTIWAPLKIMHHQNDLFPFDLIDYYSILHYSVYAVVWSLVYRESRKDRAREMSILQRNSLFDSLIAIVETTMSNIPLSNLPKMFHWVEIWQSVILADCQDWTHIKLLLKFNWKNKNWNWKCKF